MRSKILLCVALTMLFVGCTSDEEVEKSFKKVQFAALVAESNQEVDLSNSYIYMKYKFWQEGTKTPFTASKRLHLKGNNMSETIILDYGHYDVTEFVIYDKGADKKIGTKDDYPTFEEKTDAIFDVKNDSKKVIEIRVYNWATVEASSYREVKKSEKIHISGLNSEKLAFGYYIYLEGKCVTADMNYTIYVDIYENNKNIKSFFSVHNPKNQRKYTCDGKGYYSGLKKIKDITYPGYYRMGYEQTTKGCYCKVPKYKYTTNLIDKEPKPKHAMSECEPHNLVIYYFNNKEKSDLTIKITLLLQGKKHKNYTGKAKMKRNYFMVKHDTKGRAYYLYPHYIHVYLVGWID